MGDEVQGFPCELRQIVCSSVPGRVGNWSYSTVLTLPRVPVKGDWVMWDEDWSSVCVQDVTLAPGRAVVEIEPIKTDRPDVLDELDRMGWEQHAGPWTDQ
jgi:hypothetical protein